jgi:hypothetical protein
MQAILLDLLRNPVSSILKSKKPWKIALKPLLLKSLVPLGKVLVITSAKVLKLVYFPYLPSI